MGHSEFWLHILKLSFPCLFKRTLEFPTLPLCDEVSLRYHGTQLPPASSRGTHGDLSPGSSLESCLVTCFSWAPRHLVLALA